MEDPQDINIPVILLDFEVLSANSLEWSLFLAPKALFSAHQNCDKLDVKMPDIYFLNKKASLR